MRVLGIDPGYGRCGIAVTEDDKGVDLLFSDCIETSERLPFEERLVIVGDTISDTIGRFSPDSIALEEIFFSKNQKTAMRVAEVRGMIQYVCAKKGVPITEYNPSRVKIAVTGSGRADKDQVIRMVHKLVSISKERVLDDEYDAIALSLTHLAEYRTRIG